VFRRDFAKRIEHVREGFNADIGNEFSFDCKYEKVEADPPVVDPLTGESFPKPSVPSALLNVDDWISFRLALTQIAQLCTLRLRLFKAFASRVEFTHNVCRMS